MRAFLGLSPDAETKLAIDTWRNEQFPHLQASVPTENFHVTLVFLGNISVNQLDTLRSLLDVLPKVTAFEVSLNQLGHWPKPKAFWLGCQQTAKEHLKLSKYLYNIANKSGLQLQEQEYVAHLTLARKCKIKPPTPLIPPNFKCHVNQFHLFESKSSSQGVSYAIQHSWPLCK